MYAIAVTTSTPDGPLPAVVTYPKHPAEWSVADLQAVGRLVCELVKFAVSASVPSDALPQRHWFTASKGSEGTTIMGFLQQQQLTYSAETGHIADIPDAAIEALDRAQR